jgi:hypothetical protein
MRVWSRALATGALLKPVGWKEANKDALPFESAQSYNRPGRWKYGLGFVESGRFIGRTGSFAGYNSTAMYSPARRATIAVVSTKQPNPITPPPMFQTLATVVFGAHIGFGLTPAQALEPNSFAPRPGETPNQGQRSHAVRTPPRRLSHLRRGERPLALLAPDPVPAGLRSLGVAEVMVLTGGSTGRRAIPGAAAGLRAQPPRDVCG